MTLFHRNEDRERYSKVCNSIGLKKEENILSRRKGTDTHKINVVSKNVHSFYYCSQLSPVVSPFHWMQSTSWMLSGKISSLIFESKRKGVSIGPSEWPQLIKDSTGQLLLARGMHIADLQTTEKGTFAKRVFDAVQRPVSVRFFSKLVFLNRSRFTALLHDSIFCSWLLIHMSTILFVLQYVSVKIFISCVSCLRKVTAPFLWIPLKRIQIVNRKFTNICIVIKAAVCD